MSAMTARVFNPLLKTSADRLLANGKKPKQSSSPSCANFFIRSMGF